MPTISSSTREKSSASSQIRSSCNFDAEKYCQEVVGPPETENDALYSDVSSQSDKFIESKSLDSKDPVPDNKFPKSLIKNVKFKVG